MLAPRSWIRALGIGALCAIAAPALAGCATAGTSAGTTTSSAPPLRTPTTSATPTPAGAVQLTFTDSGKTLTLHIATRLHVALDSSYWTFQPVGAPRLLKTDATGFVPPTHTCMAGFGCGTQTADYTAIAAGRTSVVATRTSCGEAMRCVVNNGHFEVHIIIEN
jgi:hypothetical protein